MGISGAGAIVAKIHDGLRNLLDETSADPEMLKGVAAGAPGVTDPDDGVVIATSYLMGWRDVPLQRMLEDTLQVPAAIDNDVNLAALGESWCGIAREAADFAFLAIGTGLGAGLFLNGGLFRGRGWTAGEIGYMLVPGITPQTARPHEPGALESVIGGTGICKQWQTYEGRTPLPATLTPTEIFDHAKWGDPAAAALLHQTSTLLARTIYNMSLVLNVPLFVLGGSIGMHASLHESTEAELAALNLRSRPKLLRSILGADAQIMGALRLALEVAGVHTPR
ncbi:sugar kinase [Edaphobacter acidisoli]|uniref:Sugar kinase n=1 Tax=Edaphobacter acidisoli TaxID=2040573 RepID=A0A916RER7_9BACT|nr:sugar kinase [Edaphobacter acidisoli]